MKTGIKTTGFVLLALLIIIAGLYVAGYRINIENRKGQQVAQGGVGRGTPGWRKAAGNGQAVAPQPGDGQGQGQGGQAVAPQPGGGQGQRRGGGAAGAGGGAGSGMGQGAGAGQGNKSGGGGQTAQAGRQPGFGPSGGILLPIKVGTDSIPVLVNGKQAAKFVGKDLTDHVEDTTLATPEGPRKGWSVLKTFSYLKIGNVKELVVIDAAGKKQNVSAQQLNDPQTIAMFTYNEKGQLMLISGPKVRGVSKGMTSLEQVKQMVADRKDLFDFPNVVKIEVKS